MNAAGGQDRCFVKAISGAGVLKKDVNDAQATLSLRTRRDAGWWEGKTVLQADGREEELPADAARENAAQRGMEGEGCFYMPHFS